MNYCCCLSQVTTFLIKGKLIFTYQDFGSISDFEGMYPFHKTRSHHAGHSENSDVMIGRYNTQCSLALGKSKRK
jgi:hypothetical protein